MSFATSNGTARQPGDYAAASGKVTIPAGATTAAISVPIADNQAAEGNENFSVFITANLCSLGSAAIADSQGVATIVDNDGGVNQQPSATNDSATTTRDTAVAILVLANDADPDGDSLTVSIAAQPGHGAATVNGSEIIYTPNADFVGVDSFTYSVAGGRGGAATATASVTVTEETVAKSSIYLPIIQQPDRP